MLPPSDGSLVSKLCMDILRKDMDSEQVERHCAFIAVRDDCGFNELIPVKAPYMPDSLRAYNRLSKNDQNKFRAADTSYFSNDGEGGRFYAATSNAQFMTERNLKWLKRMKAIFDKDGAVNASRKVQHRIDQFTAANDPQPEPERELAGAGAGNWRE
jgi:hypothetical protein